ncbi:MAG TPA: hypothetical protein PK280_14060 [Planctomycetota bacterium]|nr:hypothetical protein [Planctomycetota bacterium]
MLRVDNPTLAEDDLVDVLWIAQETNKSQAAVRMALRRGGLHPVHRKGRSNFYHRVGVCALFPQLKKRSSLSAEDMQEWRRACTLAMEEIPGGDVVGSPAVDRRSQILLEFEKKRDKKSLPEGIGLSDMVKYLLRLEMSVQRRSTRTVTRRRKTGRNSR